MPVDTIAFGTRPSGIDRPAAGSQPVPVDGETLRAVAEQTGGSYHEAGSADELRAVYDDIGSSVGYTTETRRTSRPGSSASALILALLAAVASMFWFARIP